LLEEVNSDQLSESDRKAAITLSELSPIILESDSGIVCHNSGFSISSLLKTPFKSSLEAIPDTLRFLAPGTNETPLIKFVKYGFLGEKWSINTPHFPITEYQ
jgi:hypothetical protein